MSSHMNHQHILGLEWYPLSPSTLLMTTRYIDGVIEVETAESAYSLVPLSAHQRNAIEWCFVGRLIVAPFYMLTVSMWLTYSTFVRLLPRMSSHMNHQHILGLEWCPLSPSTLLMTTRYIDGALKVSQHTVLCHYQPSRETPLNGISLVGLLWLPFILTVSMWFTYSTFVRLLCSMSSNMNHQHILGLEW